MSEFKFVETEYSGVSSLKQRIPHWKSLAVFTLIAILAVSITVSASYVMTSNHVSGTPKAQVNITLTSNSTAPTVGDVLALTAHVTDGSSGVAIVLSNNGVNVGQPVNTDSSGNAVFYVVVSVAYDFVASGSHN